VPSCSRKAICGWTNYSELFFCYDANSVSHKKNKVTSQKMIEREMDYRGSKSRSDFYIRGIGQAKFDLVKEQRVDGSWYINPVRTNKKLMYLRCTLMGFERNYQTRVLSNQISAPRFYTSKVQQYRTTSKPDLHVINPNWLTGFTDGEGCFSVGVFKNSNNVGWQVKLGFEIYLHIKDKAILEQIKNYFGVGNIYHKDTLNKIQYRVQSTNDLAKIISHFDQFPLITQKLADFQLFKEAYNLVLNREHLTLSGLSKIVAIKALMNRSLSDKLKTAFPCLQVVDN